MTKRLHSPWNLFAAVGVFFLSNAAMGAAGDSTAEIARLVQAFHSVRHFNGAVLVAKGGEVIFKQGCGMANREWGVPNRPDTKFRLGSITKQFTSAVVLQLVDEGRIDIGGRLIDYLPDYRADTGKRVTIHHLLTHTSGIPSYTGLPRFFEDISRRAYSPADFVAEFCSGDLEFEPGASYRYNNSGYFLLGAVIEAVTGQPYHQVVRERIFEPLEMRDSGYDSHTALIARRADGYNHGFDGYSNAEWLDMSLPYAAGSLYSTVEDLFRWDRALAAGRVVTREMQKRLFNRHVKAGRSFYGYGWVIGEVSLPGLDKPLRVIGHGGGINGFNTILERYPEEDILIVVLNNCPGARLTDITGGILRILHGQPWDPPKQSIAESIYPEILAKGGKAGIALYHELESKRPGEFLFAPGELNRLGTHLMDRKGRIDDAVEVFRLNAEVYPEDADIWDSLAEGHMRRGETEQAVAFYKKSLELNPNNSNARAKLEELRK